MNKKALVTKLFFYYIKLTNIKREIKMSFYYFKLFTADDSLL